MSCTAQHVSSPTQIWHSNRVFRCFSDGFPNLFIRDALTIRNRNVAFLCSFHEPAKIFEQISVIYAIPRLFIGSFTLVLPFFPTGTLERVRNLANGCCCSRLCCLWIVLCVRQTLRWCTLANEHDYYTSISQYCLKVMQWRRAGKIASLDLSSS